MKHKDYGSTDLLKSPMVLVVILVLALAVVVAKKMMPPAQQMPTDTIETVEHLDKASGELDNVDVDGLGDEFDQMDADAASF